MDNALMAQVIVTGAIELLMFPLLVLLIRRIVGRKLDTFDEKREIARVERAEEKRHEHEQREAEHAMLLAIARTMLLDNYEKCIGKGYYSREEREIYSLMYHEYKLSNGNGVIDTIAERIRNLPLEPPEDSDD